MSAVARLVTVALGVACGFAASRLADAIPRRLGVHPPASGGARQRRLAAAVLVCGATGFLCASEGASWSRAVVTVLFTGILVAASAIDLEHMILPNALTFGGALAALASAPLVGHGARALAISAVGAAVGVVATLLPHAVYRVVRKRAGVGLGDAKLLVFVGAWLGPVDVIVTLFLGAVAMVAWAVLLRLIGARIDAPASVRAELDALRARAEAGDAEARADLDDDPMAAPAEHGVLTTRLPFGPFLAAGALVAALAPESVTRAITWVITP